ncbi:MAG TPA: ABC transporter permease [Haloplasmataceae bacterium]
MDNFYFLMQQMLYFSIPLLIVALGGMFSERSGVVNIALEGIMLFGAFFGVLFVNYLQSTFPNSLNYMSTQQLFLLIGLLVAGVVGILFSLFHAYASINMKANQVISGTALNMFAPAITIFIARSMAFTNYTQQVGFKGNLFIIKRVPILGDIPFIGDILFKQVYITTYIGLLILIISYIVTYKTPFGLRLRSCGEHPQAAASAGIDVYRMRYYGVGLSGLLGGIGGYIFIVTTSTEYNATVAGYGFLALAVLIFGEWKPIRIFLASLFFGLMKTIASAHTGIKLLANLQIPSEFYRMIPFLATLAVLALASKNTQGPKAAGEVYEASKR